MGSRLGACHSQCDSTEKDRESDVDTPRKVGIQLMATDDCPAAGPSSRFPAPAGCIPNPALDPAKINQLCYEKAKADGDSTGSRARVHSVFPKCCMQKENTGRASSQDFEDPPEVVVAPEMTGTTLSAPSNSPYRSPESASPPDQEVAVCDGEADTGHYLRKGHKDIKLRCWDSAVESFSDALKLAEGSEDALTRDVFCASAFAGRGRARLRLNQLAQAQQDLAHALQLDPGLASAASDLSEANLRLYLAPLDAEALLARGKAKLASRDYQSAAVDLVLSVRLGCPDAQALLDQTTAAAESDEAHRDQQAK